MLAAEPIKIRQLTLKNRLMMSPMCMFCSDQTELTAAGLIPEPYTGGF